MKTAAVLLVVLVVGYTVGFVDAWVFALKQLGRGRADG